MDRSGGLKMACSNNIHVVVKSVKISGVTMLYSWKCYLKIRVQIKFIIISYLYPFYKQIMVSNNYKIYPQFIKDNYNIFSRSNLRKMENIKI